MRFWYPVLVGVLLGLTQTGLFFQLSFTLSSSFGTFLMVTLAWLVGSAIGTATLSQKPLKILLLLMLTGYGAVNLFVTLLPFRTGWWWLYALIIVLIGLYPGAFFARMGRYYPARLLFFRENNGFITGIVTGTLLFMLYGRVVLWGLPVVLALLLLAIPKKLLEKPQGQGDFVMSIKSKAK
jgi:hypothetical protein